MHLLFTSTGRRGYLLRWFREALAGQGAIHAANSDPLAAGLLAADHRFITPPIHDPGYIDALLAYCAKHGIQAIIPLFDIDIPVLAKHEALFRDAGVRLVCASLEVATLCNDKWATHQWLVEQGIGTPDTWCTLHDAGAAIADGRLTFPVVVKPRWGMGSIGVQVAHDAEELRLMHGLVLRAVQASYLRHESAGELDRAVLFQAMAGGQEHGLDVVNDLSGRHVATFVKRKLAMRSGETDAAVTVDDPALRALGAKLAEALGHRANLDVDVFVDGDRHQVLEMNARFGGGYPFSHLAGADLPRAIIAWLRGETADHGCFAIRHGAIGVKDIEPRAWQER